MIFWQAASAGGCPRIFTLVHWTFGILAMPARTKDEIRLKWHDKNSGVPEGMKRLVIFELDL